MQMDITDSPDPASREAILDVLIAHTEQQLGPRPPKCDLGLFLRGPDGAVIGGLSAVCYWDWMFVETFFLPEALRGGGLGRRLMAVAESYAARFGCAGIWLNTLSFQAPNLYRKLGFAEVGRLDDYPPGHKRYWFAKTDLHDSAPDVSGIEITEEPHAAEEKILFAGLIAFSEAAAGPRGFRPYAILLRDEAGIIVGGMWARIAWGWLFVELLALPEATRGSGLGTRLMALAESEARAHGCLGLYLDTASFQARPFYEKLGMSCFGEIRNQPRGHFRSLLAKRF